MIDLPSDKLPIPAAKFPYVVRVDVAWPRAMQHRGARYTFTGKEGLRIRDGLPSAKYELPGTGKRAWLAIDGSADDD